LSEIHALGAAELACAYRSGALSPVAVVQAVLKHIDRWEPHLCASYLLRPELALEQARQSQARWKKGQALSELDGVPVTIKENIATQGDPVPLGTAATRLVPAGSDAPPSARLREAGAVLVCKTTMPDYGMLSSGLSSFHPLSRNPWDLNKTPGGSSAGGAAAAAAGYGPLHIGTDIGGSLRLPAGWCGIFSLKPSLGRIPIDPPYTGRAAGPMTRTVADAAAMMAVLSRPDARDSMSLPWQDIAWSSFDQGVDHLRGLKIGLLLEAGCGLPVEPEVLAAVQAAARRFEAAGAVDRANAPVHDPGHARRHGSFLAHALAPRPEWRSMPADQAKKSCPTSAPGPTVRHRRWTASRCFTPPASSTPYAVASVKPRVRPSTTSSRRPRRCRPSQPACPLPQTIRCIPWSTSASPCHSTCRSSPRRRSTAATPCHRACRSVCRLRAGAFDDLGVSCGLPAPSN
jgi:Asp-tRNA(Asn)/Glu-tRNA(Gln) amidotransferase A subunit family amidase